MRVFQFWLIFEWDSLQSSEFLPVILPYSEQDKYQQQEQDKSPDNGCLPGAGIRRGEKDHFVFNQVTREDVNETLRNQSDGGSQEIGAGGDAAEGKAEIDQIGGDDIDAPAENHGP